MSFSPSDLFPVFPVLLINALAITGFYMACWYKQADTEDHEPVEESKEVLWRVKYYSLKYLGPFWSKPICTCPPCMASLHSLWYWLFFPLDGKALALYPLYILALCGTMKLIAVKFDL
jgi:hypothetical protein